MMYSSVIEQRGKVPFAAFKGERIYMREFRKRDGLPRDIAHWNPTVAAMLDGVETDGPIYLMVDQAEVMTGNTHRRAGVHIDGYWNPEIYAHGGGNGHGPARHTPTFPMHVPDAPGKPAGWDTGWSGASFSEPEAILLASNVSASRALVGNYEGPIGEGGDCAHLDLSNMRDFRMLAGECYAGNVTCLHESIPVLVDCQRTVVRLNVPGWHP